MQQAACANPPIIGKIERDETIRERALSGGCMEVGNEFSHYRVLEHIGRGGMADVWSAKDKRLNNARGSRATQLRGARKENTRESAPSCDLSSHGSVPWSVMDRPPHSEPPRTHRIYAKSRSLARSEM